jgi:predicted Fe-Mo cluster-binding NifX family protein
MMKVAIPMFNSRVSPRFDFASKVLVATIEDGIVMERQEHSLADLNPIRRSALLNALGINLMICGGISGFSERLFIGNGIQVIPMVQGEIEKVLDLFIRGELNPDLLPIIPSKRFHCPRGRRGRWRGKKL